MVLRHVERGEIIPLGLDLRTFGDREAQVGEDFRELVHHLADRMNRAADDVRRGQREVDALRRQLALQLGIFECRLAIRQRDVTAFAQARGSRPFGGAGFRVHRA